MKKTKNFWIFCCIFWTYLYTLFRNKEVFNIGKSCNFFRFSFTFNLGAEWKLLKYYWFLWKYVVRAHTFCWWVFYRINARRIILNLINFEICSQLEMPHSTSCLHPVIFLSNFNLNFSDKVSLNFHTFLMHLIVDDF